MNMRRSGVLVHAVPVTSHQSRFISHASSVTFVMAGLLLAGMVLAQKPPAAAPAQKPSAIVPADSNLASLSDSARDALARARPSVVQIQGFFGGNTAQAFHGSGFAVAPGGLVLTNYHVVAENIIHPEKYRLEYRTPEGRTGKITVLAIDLRHDLAVVRAEGFEAPPLALDATTPAKGSRAWS